MQLYEKTSISEQTAKILGKLLCSKQFVKKKFMLSIAYYKSSPSHFSSRNN